jgi:AcrR family transcriptional regulator
VRELRPRPCSNPPFPREVKLAPPPAGERESERARLLRSVIDLVLSERLRDLSTPRVADNAGVPIDTFLELFGDTETCYLAALDMLGDEVLQLVADPALVSEEWAAAVCDTMQRLLEHLASSPALVCTLATKALEAGPAAVDNAMDLAHEVATLLTEGAPRRARGKLAVEGIAGALWHTLYSEVVAGRGHRLPILSEYLSYVVLSPFIGTEEAARAVVTSRSRALAASSGAPLGDVGERGAEERGADDHDDQRSVAGAEDPVDLDVFEVEDGEQGAKHRQDQKPSGARELTVTALRFGRRGIDGGTHSHLDASRS